VLEKEKVLIRTSMFDKLMKNKKEKEKNK